MKVKSVSFLLTVWAITQSASASVVIWRLGRLCHSKAAQGNKLYIITLNGTLLTSVESVVTT